MRRVRLPHHRAYGALAGQEGIVVGEFVSTHYENTGEERPAPRSVLKVRVGERTAEVYADLTAGV